MQKQSKMSSEAAAWRVIAQRVASMEKGEGYLCDKVTDLRDEGHITPWQASVMRDRIRVYVGESFSAYPEDARVLDNEPLFAELRQARILAALWLALEAESDADSSRSLRLTGSEP